MRTRRKFSEQFKRAAVEKLERASPAEAAETYGISVSLLHRWAKQLGGRDSGRSAPRRRTFSREFKEATVRRMEDGATVPELASAYGVDPTVLRRWRQEARRYGGAAFSGYGKSRAPVPTSQVVIVRFTEDEYQGIQQASRTSRSSSLPDFVRTQVLNPAPSVGEIAERLDMLTGTLRRAAR